MQSLQEGDQREMRISCCRMDPLRIMSVLSFPSRTALLRNSNVVLEPCRSENSQQSQEFKTYRTIHGRAGEWGTTTQHIVIKKITRVQRIGKKPQKIRKTEN